MLQLVLFPPHDLPKLYYEARPKGPLTYTYPATFARDIDHMDTRSVVFGSGVNVDSPDLSRHPRYQQASPMRVVLQPGDVLYLPAYWHHEVDNYITHWDTCMYASPLSLYGVFTPFASLPASQVQSLPDEDDDVYRGLNVAVNFWFANMTSPIDDVALINLSSLSQ